MDPIFAFITTVLAAAFVYSIWVIYGFMGANAENIDERQSDGCDKSQSFSHISSSS